MDSHNLGSRPWLALSFCGGGLLFLLLGLMATTTLTLGSVWDRLTVLLLLGFVVGLAVLLLFHEGFEPSTLCMCLLPIGLAIFLRVFLLDYQSYDYKDFLSQWAAFFRDNGGFAAVKLPVGNYNAPYLYFMALISYFGVPDLYLIKLFSVLFDVLLAWGGLRLTKTLCQPDSHAPAVVFSVLLLLPTVVLNGAYWGQCDSVYAALVLLAMAAAMKHQPATSVLLLSAAFSFKLQAIFLLPLWCAFWFAGRVKFRHLLLFPVGYFATILPALLLGKPLWDILSVYIDQTSTYPALTLNAPSIFALIPYGAPVDENLLAKLGIAAAFLIVAAVLVFLFCVRKRVTNQMLLTAGVIFAIGVPLFLPHMHERYFMLAEVLTVVLCAVKLRRLPIALCVQIAALGGYGAYLLLRYVYPMSWGAVLLLLALILSFAALWMDTFRAAVPQNRFGNTSLFSEL
ncbi:MAG: conjugal transfer protein TraL, partial [Oscillospiraceae bacterium]